MSEKFIVTPDFFVDDKVIVGGYGENGDSIFRYLLGVKVAEGWKLFKEVHHNSVGENFELAVLQSVIEEGQNGEAWDELPEMIEPTHWKEYKAIVKDTQEAIYNLREWANLK